MGYGRYAMDAQTSWIPNRTPDDRFPRAGLLVDALKATQRPPSPRLGALQKQVVGGFAGTGSA
jgi:hypothetical protein